MLDRSFEILQAIAARGELGASIETLSAETQLSRATLYRLLKAMKSYGFVRLPRLRGHYFLGYELLTLGAQAGNTGGLREHARPALMRLSEAFQDSFFLFVQDGYYALCLEIQEGRNPTKSFVHCVGSRVLSGVGQGSLALLSNMPAAKRNEILNHNAPRLLREYGIAVARLREAVTDVRRQGYTCGLSDKILPLYTGVAVPIRGTEGTAMGALSSALLTSRLTEPYQSRLVAAMQREADGIATRLSLQRERAVAQGGHRANLAKRNGAGLTSG
ncbi:IclR family transcriptional regulator [Pseudomonas typographi]|uniref:Helix-turn-helix domain-containing protein n=2 Tax=Pseudomonas typographi TaxID=2715964 RepID=A0ABR7Z7U6_9PSED|nr:helix-turn-helix domain-containing protein [Pseudomonas typographi]MBD1601609.1 helix-turn-helix domain-containing protein [Pseudomonas typographi]